MQNLDDVSAIKKLDTANVAGSLQQFGDQCQHAWDEASKIQFPDSFKSVSNIVFSGMGGSALGAYVLKSLYNDQFTVPFEIVNDYHIPAYVSQKSLVILGSYSGSTEETLSCAREAMDKKACVTGLTVGGTLGSLLEEHHIPYYKINPLYNPSNQPRLGTGYSIFGQIALLTTLGFLHVSQHDVSDVVGTLTSGKEKYDISVPTEKNEAKKMAQEFIAKIPIIAGAEFLGQTGRVIRNQIHECAKAFADYHMIPELNHHLMEGLTNPGINKQTLIFLFLTSQLYSERIAKRFTVTKDVIGKQGIQVKEFVPTSTTKLSQVFECIQFGAFVNYYMAILYGVDPSKIPWVDYFKAQLSK